MIYLIPFQEDELSLFYDYQRDSFALNEFSQEIFKFHLYLWFNNWQAFYQRQLNVNMGKYGVGISRLFTFASL